MKTFKIPVQWEVYGMLEVEAYNLEHAMELVRTDTDLTGECFPLPEEDGYIEGSFKAVDYTLEEIAVLFNDAMYE